MTEVERSSKGLRDVLFQTIDDLRAKRIDASDAKSIALLASTVIDSVHMEIAVAKLRSDYPGDTKLVVPPPLKLDAKGIV